MKISLWVVVLELIAAVAISAFVVHDWTANGAKVFHYGDEFNAEFYQPITGLTPVRCTYQPAIRCILRGE